MAVNLVGRLGVGAARELLEQSFAQFQADRSVVGLARRIERNTEALAGYAGSMRCHLGDFAEYAALRRRVGEREKALRRQGMAQQRDATTRRRCARCGPATSSRCRAGGGPGWPSCSTPGVNRRRRPAAAGAHRGPLGRPAVGRGLPDAGDRAGPDAAAASTSTTAPRGCAATWRRRCATPASSPRRARGAAARARAPAGRRPGARHAAPGAARAPLPRLRRPGGARPVGRAARPAGARDRAAAAEGPGHHALAGPAVRPDPRAAGRARLPRRRRRGRDRDPAGRAAGPAVGRVRPAGRRVPAARGLGRPRARRAGRGRLRAGLRVAPGPRAGAARARLAACRRRWPRPCGCGPSWRPTSAATGSTAPASRTSGSPGRCTGGRAASRCRPCSPRRSRTAPSCRRATSSAGAARCSTCSTRSRRSPGATRRSGGRPRRRRRSVRRGVVAAGTA